MKYLPMFIVLCLFASQAVWSAAPAADNAGARALVDAAWITGPAAEEDHAPTGRLHFRHTFVLPYESKGRTGGIGCALQVAAKAGPIRMSLNGFFLAEEASPANRPVRFQCVSSSAESDNIVFQR